MHAMRHPGQLVRLTAVAVLLTGPAAGQFLEPDVTVLHTHLAEVGGDSFGFVAESIGDQDGDGAPEYVIGAPFNDEAGANAGKAYVYSGADGTLVHSVVGASSEQLGFAVAGIGDANCDAVPDYAVGGPGTPGSPSGNTGRVLVVSGADHAVLHDLRGTFDSQYGYDLDGAGDVDGCADVVVGALGAAGGAGEASVVSGLTGATLWTAAGVDAGDGFGSGVAGVDDLDRDGVPEQAIGARFAGADGTGLAYLLSGADGSTLTVLEPLASAGNFGWFFVHDAGDVNGDGRGDVYVGDFGDSRFGSGSGRGYVYSGRGGRMLWVYNPDGLTDGLGMGRGAGDVNDDGFADLLLGAFTNSDGAIQGGKAYLRSGRNGLVMRTFTGTQLFAQIGFDVVVLGDVDADGLGDYLLTGVDVAYVVAGTEVDDDALSVQVQ